MANKAESYRWGIRRFDTGDDKPVVLVLDNYRNGEKEAREWHASLLQAHERWVENHPDEEPPQAPELVRSPLNWEVVE